MAVDERREPEASRRTVLGTLMGAGTFFLAAVLGAPAALVALTPALRRRKEAWRALGSLEDYQLGAVRKTIVHLQREDWAKSLQEKAVYLWRSGEQEVVVYSRNCTDLSCPVNFDPGSECFFCPCHGGIFTKEGEPLAGPPKRPLDRYAVRIREGVVEIDLDSLSALA